MAMLAATPPHLPVHRDAPDDFNFDDWVYSHPQNFQEDFAVADMTQISAFELFQSPSLVVSPPNASHVDDGNAPLSAVASPTTGLETRTAATCTSSPISFEAYTPNSTVQDSEDAFVEDQDLPAHSLSPASAVPSSQEAGDSGYPEYAGDSQTAGRIDPQQAQSGGQGQTLRSASVTSGLTTSLPYPPINGQYSIGWGAIPVASTGAWTEMPLEQQNLFFNGSSAPIHRNNAMVPNGGDILSGIDHPIPYTLPVRPVPGYTMVGPAFLTPNIVVPQLQYQQHPQQAMMQMSQYYHHVQDPSMALLLPQYHSAQSLANPTAVMYRPPYISLASNPQWHQDNLMQTAPPQAHYQPVAPEGAHPLQPHGPRPVDLQARHAFIPPSTLQVNTHQHQPSCQPHLLSPSDESEYATDFSSSQSRRRNMPMSNRQLLVKTESGSKIGPVRGHIDKRKGGRQVGKKLEEGVRAKSHNMRKTGACWGCRLQRDECDAGKPCSRCVAKASRVGAPHYFECDRSKLPDFVHDFLPSSMTVMHQKQGIEDTVVRQVRHWDNRNGINVLLSCGYGPPMTWTLYEFVPVTAELTSQLQYKRDKQTGQIARHQSWSPPFGLMKLDPSDDGHFQRHMAELLLPQHLADFGWIFYREEVHLDPSDFQATLLRLLSELYSHTTDDSLKKQLGDVLRLLVVTYIMGHTLTIQHDNLRDVISAVRHTHVPAGVLDNKFVSPRLANRQLKFFFHQIRSNIYDTILKNYQATLRVHRTGVKEQTWLESFCVMLGFAMSLEELQRLLVIQADAKAAKGELSPDWAAAEARNAISRIDDRFALLTGLFQCKYRDRTWGESGSFGPGTPELRDPVAHNFLREARKLVEQSGEFCLPSNTSVSRDITFIIADAWILLADHLQSRANVDYSPENQSLLTTRLTAKFLLPFLNLPKT